MRERGVEENNNGREPHELESSIREPVACLVEAELAHQRHPRPHTVPAGLANDDFAPFLGVVGRRV